MSNPKNWDEYEIMARYLPCFIAIAPIVHFLIQFLGKSFWEEFASNIGWLLVANISLSLMLTLGLIQIQCGIAKHWIEESIFGKGGINFPTTYLLLFRDPTLSKNMKLAIRQKVVKDFNFKMMDEHQENNDVEEAKRLNREVVGFIRGHVRKGIMVHQYNIRYGFMRNLIGGSLWASAGSFGCAVLYGLRSQWTIASFFILTGLIFSSILIFKNSILNKLADQYAQTLFSEYLTLKGEQK